MILGGNEDSILYFGKDEAGGAEGGKRAAAPGGEASCDENQREEGEEGAKGWGLDDEGNVSTRIVEAVADSE